MTNHSLMKLGKLPPVFPAHVPTLAKVLAYAPLPTPPDVVDWTKNIAWPMLANDTVGDCAFAGPLHAIQASQRWRDGVATQPTDEQALAAYSAVTGFNPQDPATDSGAVLADVMAWWRATGFQTPSGTNQIQAYARLENLDHLKAALWLFGPLIVGAALPVAAQTQPVWASPANLTGNNTPGSWGGHCMVLGGIDATGAGRLITWGDIKLATAGWLKAYLDEVWIPVQPEWVMSGMTPCGELASAIVGEIGEL